MCIRMQNMGAVSDAQPMLREPIPAWLQSIMRRIDELGILPPTNHVLINEYTPGQGILPHTDGPLYTPVIATVSLQSHTVLDLYATLGEAPRASLLLQPRSLLLLANSLYEGLHGIAERDSDVASESMANLSACPGVAPGDTLIRGTRMSLTIRNVPHSRAMPWIALLRK
jgi:alkylated DNA repair protein alkB family protein 6